MNNDQYQNAFKQRPMIAADFRNIARRSLKGFWWTAILVTLIASFLGGVVVSGVNFEYNTGASVVEEEYDPDAEANEEVVESEEWLSPEEKAAIKEVLEETFINYNFEPIKALLAEKFPAIGFVFSIIGIIFGVALVFSVVFHLFVSSPVKVGYQRFFLEVIDGNTEAISVRTLFRFFKQSYGKTIGLNIVHGLIMELTAIPMLIGLVAAFFSLVASLPAMLTGSATAIGAGVLTALGIFMLGALISLCISIPVSYTYSMAHILMADYPGIGAIRAMRISRLMMKGKKWRLFCLDCSFIGWYLLGACACGLGAYIVTPYQYAARAAFYHEISNRKAPTKAEIPSIDPENDNVDFEDYDIED